MRGDGVADGADARGGKIGRDLRPRRAEINLDGAAQTAGHPHGQYFLQGREKTIEVIALIEQRCALTVRRLTDPAADGENAKEQSS